MLISRVNVSGPNEDRMEYAIRLRHRATGRAFEVRLTGDQFAQVLTAMGGVYGTFEEVLYPRKGTR